MWDSSLASLRKGGGRLVVGAVAAVGAVATLIGVMKSSLAPPAGR